MVRKTIEERVWQVHFTSEVRLPREVSAKWFEKIARNILSDRRFQELASELSEVSIRVVDDSVMHELNLRYRQKDKPTDVLSFANDDGTVLSTSIGDLVISLDTARVQARRFRITLQRELTRLMVHGILHLAGYDHEGVSAAKAQRMRRAERAISSRVLRTARS